jgi:hypothetical protein
MSPDNLGNRELGINAGLPLELTLLYGAEPSSHDLRIVRLSQFLGIPCKIASHDDITHLLHSAQDDALSVICSAATVARLLSDRADSRCAWDVLLEKARVVLIYGFQPQEPEVSVATRVTDAQLSGVCRLARADLQYDVSCSHPEITAEFTGLSLGRVSTDVDFAFIPRPAPTNWSPLVSIGDLPFYCCCKQGSCSLFLLACAEVIDISQKTTRTVSVNDTFSRLMPIAMFLRSVFGQRAWHNPHRLANFIIDDPLLIRSYGYLKYKDLLPQLDETGVTASIAFIPWNYKTTEPAVARLFRDNTDRLSVCIHGCDHTGAEFGSTDVAILNTKVRLASQRMNHHQQSTGVSHCEVMIFPQGQFSLESLKVLQAHNYLAAINSGPLPSNKDGRDSLTVSDFLRPAITRYSGCALFMRRYPEYIEQCAFDLFWGKPLLFVEHHTYLHDGYRGLRRFVDRLSSVRCELKWCNLADTLTNTYDQRLVNESTTLLRMYANGQLVENSADVDKTFIVSMPCQCDGAPVDKVFLNGESVPFKVCDGTLQVALRVLAGHSAAIKLLHTNSLPYALADRGLMRNTRTWTRRLLSQMRDNVLCRSRTTASYFHNRPFRAATRKQPQF